MISQTIQPMENVPKAYRFECLARLFILLIWCFNRIYLVEPSFTSSSMGILESPMTMRSLKFQAESCCKPTNSQIISDSLFVFSPIFTMQLKPLDPLGSQMTQPTPATPRLPHEAPSKNKIISLLFDPVGQDFYIKPYAPLRKIFVNVPFWRCALLQCKASSLF